MIIKQKNGWRLFFKHVQAPYKIQNDEAFVQNGRSSRNTNVYKCNNVIQQINLFKHTFKD